MLSAMYREHHDVIADDAEVNGVRKPTEDCAPRFSSYSPTLHRVLDNSFDCFVESLTERCAKAIPATFVPVSGFECFRFSSLGSKRDPTVHSRSVSLRRTSDQGIADSGR
jgi:hypothetical protein